MFEYANKNKGTKINLVKGNQIESYVINSRITCRMERSVLTYWVIQIARFCIYKKCVSLSTSCYI